MASMAPQMMSQLGQLPQMSAQPLQMLGQFPQMLGQMPQMAMGMLGPLTQGMSGGGAGGAGIDKAGQFDQTTLAATTDAAARGGGGGGAGGIGGGAGLMSSFTRPTGSFNAPGPPKLPTGWAPAAGVPEVAASASPAAGGGTGGLYGARLPRRCRPHGARRTRQGRLRRGQDHAADGWSSLRKGGLTEKLVQRPPRRRNRLSISQQHQRIRNISGNQLLVGADKLRAAADQLENLRNEAEGTLTITWTPRTTSRGGWQGDASMAERGHRRGDPQRPDEAQHPVGRADPRPASRGDQVRRAGSGRHAAAMQGVSQSM